MNLTTVKKRLEKLKEGMVCANARLTLLTYIDGALPPVPPRCPLCGEVHDVLIIRIVVVETREEAKRLQNGQHPAS
jgi:hypothetical protein